MRRNRSALPLRTPLVTKAEITELINTARERFGRGAGPEPTSAPPPSPPPYPTGGPTAEELERQSACSLLMAIYELTSDQIEMRTRFEAVIEGIGFLVGDFRRSHVLRRQSTRQTGWRRYTVRGVTFTPRRLRLILDGEHALAASE